MTEEQEYDPLDDENLIGDLVDDAMMILVSTYSTIPMEELDETSVDINAGRVCEILELFMAYINRYEDIDLNKVKEAIDMELQATVIDTNDIQIH